MSDFGLIIVVSAPRCMYIDSEVRFGIVFVVYLAGCVTINVP